MKSSPAHPETGPVPDLHERPKQIVTLVVVLIYCAIVAWIYTQSATVEQDSDLFPRWYPTRKLIEEGRSLYDPHNAAEASAHLHFDKATVQVSYFYPAHLLLFTFPLALLPFPAANLIWVFVIQCFYIAAIWIFMRLMRWPTTINRIGAFLFASLLFIPNIQHTVWGQFNTIGMLGLALCMLALTRHQYALAGVWAIGLTFKPQTTLLPLVFLLLWVLFKRERWAFYASFGLGGLGLLLVTLLIMPGWIGDWLRALNEYYLMPNYDHTSALDRLWNPYQIVSILAVLGALALFIRCRTAEPDQPAFVGCFSLSILIGYLVFSFLGVFHIVLAPALTILLAGALSRTSPGWARAVTYTALAIYVLGWAGHIYYLLTDQFGVSEMIYKVAVPLVGCVFAIRLAWMR